MLAACHSMPTSGPKLLVVEDNPDLRTLISTILTTCGYGVRSSSDGLSALREIRADMPDIVLSDLFMPGMSGFELLSVIRRRFPGIQVISMSSAYSGGQTRASMDADAFYEKATNLQSLLAIIEEIRKSRTAVSGNFKTSRPIWIAAAEENYSGEVRVLLSCAECLRTFAEGFSRISTTIREAACPFCLMPIRYALVPACPQV
jgi:CheY-like chemotaxis protein